MSKSNWRDCSSLSLSEICMPFSVINQETIRLRPSESLCPLNLEQLVTRSRSNGCSSSLVLRFRRSASMKVMKICTRESVNGRLYMWLSGTYLSRFSNLLSSLRTRLGRVLYRRRYPNLNPMQCSRIIHLYGVPSATDRAEKEVMTYPITGHELLDWLHFVSHQLEHSFVLRQQSRTCRRISLWPKWKP